MAWNGGLRRLSPSSLFARWVESRHSCSKLFVGGNRISMGVGWRREQLDKVNGEYGFSELFQGLSYDTNESVLKDAFGNHGEIIQVKVICDHVTGKSKGYGFVHFKSETAAITALMQMDGQVIDGRCIRIQHAHNGWQEHMQ